MCTVEEAAGRLKLSEHTVRAAVRCGSIPAVKLGRLVRISEETMAALERVGHPLLTKRAGQGGGS
jgi:excisionase family DNA binding protein